MAELSHFDEHGAPRMVDVSGKKETAREARARATVRMKEETLALILSDKVEKGDVFQVARLAGIQAVKRTAELIPLCHPLRVTSADVSLVARGKTEVAIETVVRAFDRTG